MADLYPPSDHRSEHELEIASGATSAIPHPGNATYAGADLDTGQSSRHVNPIVVLGIALALFVILGVVVSLRT